MDTRHLNPDGTPKFTNRLIGETSPYLRQHAHNPVDWYPWGEEAFTRALQEGKPIHLSVGYAACHWCHVLAAESFEDEATAHVLNQLYVNIKVDREERPDVDRIYQIAQQMLTQRSGGWPLTMFLTPDDRRPFFGGTYFPKQARFGLPAFGELLLRVARFYREREAELRHQNEALMSAFAQLEPPSPDDAVELNDAPLRLWRQALEQTFDPRSGGFGAAPKFPHATSLELLLRQWRDTADSDTPDLHALYMSGLTLRRMGDGGINDQLAGGFCRYSVDEYWMIPHFEKMLYDNGSLLAVYADAYVATGDAFYGKVAAETADWVRREMQSPEGGYYSSLDADSEGHEGKFYVWNRDEVRSALTAAEYEAFAPRYGLDREPNFEGHWHLHVFRSVEDIASTLGRPSDEVTSTLDSAREKLLRIRERRIRPGRDDKILASWNGLMIRGLAVAARALGRDDLADSATRALEFVRRTLWRNGRLLATYNDGRAHLNAYLDDYAFLADAVLELQQVRFRADELQFARELLEVILLHYADEPSGGFFFTSDDHEQLIHRPKSFGDDATPAGNGIAAFALQRMGYLLGDGRYLEAAERTIRAGWAVMERYPQGHTSLLMALEEVLSPPQVIVLRGDPGTIESWRRELAKLYSPRRMVLAVPTDAPDLPAAIAEKTPRGAAVAYVCRGNICGEPIASFADLTEALRA
ncbi:MAG: thioredoxin domain-containing protein [Steroidobacteraceae bacterium]